MKVLKNARKFYCFHDETIEFATSI